MSNYNILSLDGGGIRGVFSARLLMRLEQRVPGFLEKIDLFAGTSTGGILALGLAAGIKPAELVSFYRDNGSIIFDDNWLDNLKDLSIISGAQYDNQNLKRVLSQVLKQYKVVTLNDLSKRVLIPAFDLDDSQDPRRKLAKPRSWKPKFFHNYPGADSDGQELIIDVAMRTSAAPTYFPTYDRYIDGGVVANNPSMAALAQAINAQTGQQDITDIHLLSIGTGINPIFIEGIDLDWGYAQWAKPITSLMLDGAMGVADYQCQQVLGERYHRVNCALEQPVPLDCYQKMENLIRYANEMDIEGAASWLRKHIVY